MSKKSVFIFLTILSILAISLAACTGPAGEQGPQGEAGPQGPEGPSPTVGCVDCHNSGTETIFVKHQQWEKSLHGEGTSWAYAGTRASCAGCHSSEGFAARVAGGNLGPEEITEAPMVASNANCRTCHQIHTTYTAADWALTTTEPVALYAFEDATFDGGAGNLCASCHQPRRIMEAGTDGMFEITSTHWGPHHGPQSSMLLGIGGAGVEGRASSHATMVEDTCVSCHVGDAKDHTFAVDFGTCADCHDGAEEMVDELQAEIAEMAEEVEARLEALGPIHDGHPAKGVFAESDAQAAWNWIYIVLEDKSMGVHNPAYTKAMLEAALESLPEVVVEEAAPAE